MGRREIVGGVFPLSVTERPIKMGIKFRQTLTSDLPSTAVTGQVSTRLGNPFGSHPHVSITRSPISQSTQHCAGHGRSGSTLSVFEPCRRTVLDALQPRPAGPRV